MNSPAITPRGRSRFLPNTMALVVQTIVASVITLAQVKILANYLSKDTFGLFASLRGFSLLLAIIAANGLPQLLVRFLPAHESQGERQRALRLGAASVAWSLVVLLVLVGVVQLLRPWLLAFTGALADSGVLLWFYAMTLGVTLKAVIYGGLNGLRRLGTQMALETSSLLAVLLWIAVERDHLSLLLLFRIFGTVHLLTTALAMPLFILSLARLPHRVDSGGSGIGPEKHRYRPYMVWATGLSFVALAFTDVDRYLLAQLLTLEMLALFHIGARVSQLAKRLLGVSNLAFQPEITRLQEEGRVSEVVSSTRMFMKFNSALAALIMFAIILFAREIITFVASVDYLAAYPLLVLLSLCLPLATATAPLTTVMKALDQVRGALISDIVWASAYVALMIVLAPGLGLVGVGCAQLCAYVLQLLVALRLSSLSLGPSFVTGLILRLLAAGSVAFLPVLLTVALPGGSPGALLGMVKIMLFAGGLFVFRGLIRKMNIFTREERDRLYAMFDSRGIRFVRGVL